MSNWDPAFTSVILLCIAQLIASIKTYGELRQWMGKVDTLLAETARHIDTHSRRIERLEGSGD